MKKRLCENISECLSDIQREGDLLSLRAMENVGPSPQKEYFWLYKYEKLMMNLKDK